MKPPKTVSWPRRIAAARRLQEQLRTKVITEDMFEKIHTVAGIDVGFEKNGTVTRAAVVVLDFPGLTLREQVIARRPTRFPYVPGYLSFREAPAALAALKKLRTRPDLVLCDGQGLAHPRRFGLACHLGLLANIPSIGVAKSRLIGTHEKVPEKRGCWRPLVDNGEMIGVVLRTRTGVKPVYVSVGYGISLTTAIAYVMHCTTRYRLPETTRLAHKLAST
ncbi:MAG: deoxyribonuclease V [Sulfuricaulis sp.]|jgi:deoxyribonuclease V|uniref:deoxyribonuclease V n=1 Tax=Sulfuricaulis sp. TaxID=2003553 RepID=UPI002BA98666|nr:deoxyribonuclease V [Sulfuricaulis sp.]